MEFSFDYQTLISGVSLSGLVDNSCFMPGSSVSAARHTLGHTLFFPKSLIHTDSSLLKSRRAGLTVDKLPQCELSVMSVEGCLVPENRSLIHCQIGDCFWSIAFSPGKTWSQLSDGGMSRATLPFELCNVLENDTHHGLMTFLFSDETVSFAYFQIVTETAPFLIGGSFDGWGVIKVSKKTRINQRRMERVIRLYEKEKKSQLELQDIAYVSNKVPTSLFHDLSAGVGADTTIVSGLVIGDKIFTSDCHTRAGPFPLPRSMRFGIWSVTKTAFATVAVLRLAQKFGEDCRRARIAELLPEAKDATQWNNVTIGHCLDMATAVGTVAPNKETNDIFADYILDEASAKLSDEHKKSFEHYFSWFLARDQRTKTLEAVKCPRYPWAPGTISRYRDQDLYLAGAAMDAWLKERQGTGATLVDLVLREVYEAAGMHHVIKFETVETQPERKIPLTQSGLLLTIDNVARLGKLLQNDGVAEDQQLLSSALINEFFNPAVEKGLRTGKYTEDGEIHYCCATWHIPYKAKTGKLFWLPTMWGYGGQIIQLLPNGMVAFRFAHDSNETEERYDLLKLARIADALTSF